TITYLSDIGCLEIQGASLSNLLIGRWVKCLVSIKINSEILDYPANRPVCSFFIGIVIAISPESRVGDSEAENVCGLVTNVNFIYIGCSILGRPDS
ncbi:hypothetical protein, partial [Escherichia coli]|uniref:hypothetical protein n=1 Tax=Escherichia coli TaxID=562 RepID=UPI003F4AF2BA